MLYNQCKNALASNWALPKKAFRPGLWVSMAICYVVARQAHRYKRNQYRCTTRLKALIFCIEPVNRSGSIIVVRPACLVVHPILVGSVHKARKRMDQILNSERHNKTRLFDDLLLKQQMDLRKNVSFLNGTFWDFLYTNDRENALRLILEIAIFKNINSNVLHI